MAFTQDLVVSLEPPTTNRPGVKPTNPFWRFFDQVLLGDGCWEWTGYRRAGGWGVFSLSHREPVAAYRVAYEWARGSIPEGLTLDHLCRNRGCVNPAHLEPVSRGENTLRGDTITARNRAKTHCLRGHLFDDENTRLDSGKRVCRACKRLAERGRRERSRLSG